MSFPCEDEVENIVYFFQIWHHETQEIVLLEGGNLCISFGRWVTNKYALNNLKIKFTLMIRMNMDKGYSERWDTRWFVVLK